MARTVVLLHTLPDGTSHFDWLLERRGEPGVALLAFRTVDNPAIAPVEFRAERLADHRAAYLEYEGEVAGGRGQVVRAASGDAEVLFESPTAIVAVVCFGGREVTWRGEALGGGWTFRPGLADGNKGVT